MLAPIHPIPNRGSWIRPCSVTDLRRFKEQFNGKRSRYSQHICVVIFVTKPHTLQTTYWARAPLVLRSIRIFGRAVRLTDASNSLPVYWDSFQKSGDQFEIFNINLSRNFISELQTSISKDQVQLHWLCVSRHCKFRLECIKKDKDHPPFLRCQPSWK